MMALSGKLVNLPSKMPKNIVAKEKFIFTTHDHKTITLRSDILYDGWADFEEYVLDMADIYEIAIN